MTKVWTIKRAGVVYDTDGGAWDLLPGDVVKRWDSCYFEVERGGVDVYDRSNENNLLAVYGDGRIKVIMRLDYLATPDVTPDVTPDATGLSLRDYFAGCALTGLCSYTLTYAREQWTASAAYRAADAMMRERGSSEGSEGSEDSEDE